jgi:hypothetical protein
MTAKEGGAVREQCDGCLPQSKTYSCAVDGVFRGLHHNGQLTEQAIFGLSSTVAAGAAGKCRGEGNRW